DHQFRQITELLQSEIVSDHPEIQFELGHAHRIYSAIKATTLNRPRRLTTIWNPDSRVPGAVPFSPSLRRNAEIAIQLLDDALAIFDTIKSAEDYESKPESFRSRVDLERARCFREKGVIVMSSRRDADLMEQSFDEATSILLRLANRNGQEKGIMEYELALTTLQSFRETSRRAPERAASAVRLARGFVDVSPGVPKYQTLLALALEKSGRVAFVKNNFAQAKDDFEAAITIYRSLLEETPNQPNYRLRLTTSEVFLAKAVYRDGDTQTARKIVERVIRKSRDSLGASGRRWKPPPQIEEFLSELSDQLDRPDSSARPRRRGEL
ncbi:MAG: hypothetical protein AAGG44_12905, partial [Planctomycetota bacterium]